MRTGCAKTANVPRKSAVDHVGYLHIKSMDGAVTRTIQARLETKPRTRKHSSLTCDITAAEISSRSFSIYLTAGVYQKWIPRDIGEEFRPHEGFFGPKAVLINSSSASNAEMFPAGFRELGTWQGNRYPDFRSGHRHNRIFVD